MSSQRKTAIVTGAPQGIGAGIVKGFVERGFNVVGHSSARQGPYQRCYRLRLENAVYLPIVEKVLKRLHGQASETRRSQ